VASRLVARLRIAPRALRAMAGRRERPPDPLRILVAHHLLLGDTLMLTPLLAKLRARYPAARVVMTVRRAFLPLYALRPYGTEAVVHEAKQPATLDALLAGDGFDLAFVPGDNRYAWLAAAARARWIVAHADERRGLRNWPADDLRPFPQSPTAWGDAIAQLADGPPPPAYRPADWPAPPCAPPVPPRGDYCVLHVGAGSRLRLWNPERWRTVAETLSSRGLQVVWSAGRGEEDEVAAADPAGRWRSFGGELSLAQLWHLLAGARLLVCPDTGIAHLGRLAGVPTLTLYGPGSPALFGPGEFWRESPCRAVAVDPFPCRDQRVIFKRRVDWVRRCQRTLAECPAPRCMHAIGVEPVLAAAAELLGG